MKPILTMAAKDLRLMLRDRGGLFWMAGFPIVMALFFGSIFGGGGGGGKALSLVVVDEDGSKAAAAYAARLEQSAALTVFRAPLATAQEQVRRGERVAYVRLKQGFGEGSLFGGGGAGLEVGLDPARKAEGGFLQGILTQAWFEGFQDQFTDPKAMKDMAAQGKQSLAENSDLDPKQREIFTTFYDGLDQFFGNVDPKVYQNGGGMRGAAIESVPIQTEQTGPASAFEISFPQGLLWGLLGCAASFGLSLVQERVNGTFLRLRIAPLSRAQVLAGKALACFVTCIGVTLGVLMFGMVCCGVRLLNPLGLTLALPSVAFCFVGLMMTVSVLGKTEASVNGAGWGMFTILSMLGGGMVPLFFMPDWMQTVSHVSPVKWAILALEGAIWRGFGVAEMAVPCAMLLLFGSAALVTGLWRFGQLERE